MKVMQMKQKVLNGIMVASLAAAGLLHGVTLQPGGSPTLEEAVAAAADGDTIELAAGVYTLTNNLTVGKALTIQGAAGTTREDVIIDGARTPLSGNPTGGYNIRLVAGSAGAVVQGLTIRNMRSTEDGGGIAMGVSNATLANCIVTNCISTRSAGGGGGVQVASSTTGTVISNCLIVANSGPYAGGVWFYGAGRLVDSQIMGNTASVSASGGVRLQNVNAMIDRCVIQGNSAATEGGGMTLSGTIRNSLVSGNTARGNGGGISGGGTVENCTVVGNASNGLGGGLYITAGPLRNLIAVGNTSVSGGNEGQDVCRSVTTISLTYSYIGTGLPNYATTSALLTQADGEPKFKDAANSDYRLRALSPCLGTGRTGLVEQAWMTTGLDLDNNPRLNGDGTVDMGCYAYQPAPVADLAISFTADTSFIEPGNTVTFTPQVEGDKTGLQIVWDFGDKSGTVTLNPDPVPHFYVQDGIYTVTATASNTAGETDVYSRILTVLPDADVYVSPGGLDIFPYTSPATAAKSIHDALDALERMSAVGYGARTLHICPGTNKLDKVLYIVRNYDIRGTGTREECIIDGCGTHNICLIAGSAGAVVRDLTIQNGRSTSEGGGIAMEAVDTMLVNCIVTNCVGGGQGGGGVWLQNGAASRIERCVIQGNRATGSGGGVWAQHGGIILNSLVSSNRANHANGGGGIHMVQAGTIENCTVVGNYAASASGLGGGLSINATGTYRNLIVAGNTSANANGLIWDVYRASTGVAITNAYIGAGMADYTNTSVIFTLDDDAPGAIKAGAPLFKDDTDADYRLRDYRLKKTSPCVNAGLWQSWMDTALDLDGNPRLFKGMVDMGAYQNQEPLIRPTLMLVK